MTWTSQWGGTAMLTHDEALLELNDRLGQEVAVTVSLEIGDRSATPIGAHGVLGDRGDRLADLIGEELAGWYDVGSSASLDITGLGGAALLTDPGEKPYGLRFELAEGVTVEVSWGVEEAS